jgi:ATP-dependent DNA helicase DinG
MTVEIIATDSDPAPVVESTPKPRIKTFAEAEERLAQTLPGYESRVPQQNLATLVEKALAEGQHAMAEAGCGTGKSLGSLIPAILWAKENRKRVVYSTATKALQEQIASKDLPFLKEHLGVPFSFALLKGRSNYLCLAKATNADPRYAPVGELLREVDDNPTHTGDREHFKITTTDSEWRNVASTSDECPGKRKCPFGEQCFAEFAKARAKTSDVVVTNHMLTFTDVKVKEASHGWASMLGDVDAYIFDEAHEIEEISTNAMSEQLRESGIRKWATEAVNFGSDWREANPETLGEQVTVQTMRVWSMLPDGKDGIRLNLPWWVENFEPVADLITALRDSAERIANIDVQGEKAEARRATLVQRAENYADSLSMMATEDDHTLVRWVEKDERGNKVLKNAPLRVGPWLTKGIWNETPSVLVSATLSVGGDFSYVQDRLSLPDPLTMNVGTPFDFSTQARLFVPAANMPSPKDRQAWMTTTPIITTELIKASGGGALLLYTSRSSMQQAFNLLAPQLKALGINSFMQGGDDGTNKEIAAKFEADTHSCLFALKSFFTGVDFQGDTCRLVVIDKLPFPVPTDVMFAARSAEVERHGGSGFNNMSVPAMTLTLLQGFGRLIRHKTDRGVVAILDSRLSSASWGRKIVNNMPEAPVTTDLDDIRAFFAG